MEVSVASLESLVALAQEGDRKALEEVVAGIQDKVYGLALRMLYHPADAEDAAQEILIKVITKLDSFRSDSAFTTWVYRVAANHLLTARKCRAERFGLTLDKAHQALDQAQAQGYCDDEAQAYQGVVVTELRLNCMQGVLVSLERDERLALILGSVLELSSRQAAYILDVTPEAFRKRLSRARERVRQFLGFNCGLVRPGNRCQCERMVEFDAKMGWLNPKRLLFADHPRRQPDPEVLAGLDELDELGRISALLKSYPHLAAPGRYLDDLKEMIDSDRFRLLREQGE